MAPALEVATTVQEAVAMATKATTTPRAPRATTVIKTLTATTKKTAIRMDTRNIHLLEKPMEVKLEDNIIRVALIKMAIVEEGATMVPTLGVLTMVAMR